MRDGSSNRLVLCLLVGVLTTTAPIARADDRLARQRDYAAKKMKQAATYFASQVAVRGGYVYHYSLDLQTRWGEGLATKNQIWIQPPATPTVGMAYLRAYRATEDRFYLEAAQESAEAVIYGQLKSGGWQRSVDFDRQGSEVSLYRNGKGSGRNQSTFDDGQTQSALMFLIQFDEATRFAQPAVRDAIDYAFAAIFKAQYPNGGFPQAFDGPVPPQQPVKANYPPYDWREEGKVKNYWDMYTLNDNTCGYLVDLFLEAHRIYGEAKYLEAASRLGDFLILAQMPAPQRGWAQQYNYDMQPIWARKFEPPGVSGDETQEVIESLLKLHRATSDPKYLEPIPDALAWLKKSLLPGDLLARYYELKTNRPLYMERRGETYMLTYDDRRLPSHYGWKSPSRIASLDKEYRRVRQGGNVEIKPTIEERTAEVAKILREIDEQGRWISTYGDERLVGQPKWKAGDRYLASEVFSRHLTALADFLEATR